MSEQKEGEEFFFSSFKLVRGVRMGTFQLVLIIADVFLLVIHEQIYWLRA